MTEKSGVGSDGFPVHDPHPSISQKNADPLWSLSEKPKKSIDLEEDRSVIEPESKLESTTNDRTIQPCRHCPEGMEW